MDNINKSWKKVIDIITSNMDIFPKKDFRIVFKLLSPGADRDSILENFPNAEPLKNIMVDIDYVIAMAGDDLTEITSIISKISSRLFEDSEDDDSKYWHQKHIK